MRTFNDALVCSKCGEPEGGSGPCVNMMGIHGDYVPVFRALTPDEEGPFRKWARKNHRPFAEVDSLWHPVTRDECRRIDAEHTSEMPADAVEVEAVRFSVDTALCMTGGFPPIGAGDFIVAIEDLDGECGTVVVSRRYVRAVDAADAARIALDAWEERYEMDGKARVVGVDLVTE